jgi:hypothetical protein
MHGTKSLKQNAIHHTCINKQKLHNLLIECTNVLYTIHGGNCTISPNGINFGTQDTCSLWGREWILNNIWTHLCFKGSNKIYYSFHVESFEIQVSSLLWEFMCFLSSCFWRKAGGIRAADRNRSTFMSVVDLMAFMEEIASMSMITVLTFSMSSVLTYCSHMRPIYGDCDWTCCCHIPLTPLVPLYHKILIKLQQDNLNYIENHAVPHCREFYVLNFVWCVKSLRPHHQDGQ